MTTGGKRKFRDIREDHSFAECIDRLGGYDWVDELTGHLRWRLARDPFHQTFAVPGSKKGARFTFTEELGDRVPVMRVVFMVPNDDLVVLLWIDNADDAPSIGFDDWLP